MSTGELIGILGGTGGLIAGVAALVGLFLSRRTDKEAHEVQDELSEFQILRGTVDALQREVNRLNTSLENANTKAEKLNHELDNARANVLILSAHLRQYVPEVPFPKLRVMNDVD